MPKMPLPPAESIRLDTLAEVARGGMGSVELARALDGRLAGQILAVKRLHANIAEDPEFVSMFLDEAWMTAALKHPNVAQVVAWGDDENGKYLAIELVQGVSLSRLLKEAHQNQEAFAERTVAFICSQICAGLVAAHGLKAPDGSPLSLVHRDLTPANVLISFDGMVKIIDFGIAKAEERISHTRTGQLKGKPAYMAPEQQRGGNVDARTDLFSFGVLMFEMLSGRRPWTAKGAFDVMMEISNDPHPDLGTLRKGLNPEFVAIAHKCLEKKPEARFQSAAEIKARLDAWLSAKGFSADDKHSLAQFVLRNSQPQVRWWQEALRGEHSKGKKAPTFKELEEKIDEERARQAKAARQAARRPIAASGTVPMRAYPISSNPPHAIANPDTGMPDSDPVSSGQRRPPSSGNPADSPRSPGHDGGSRPQAPGHDGGSRPQAPGSGQHPAVRVPQSGQYPAQRTSAMEADPRSPSSRPSPSARPGSGGYPATSPPSSANPRDGAPASVSGHYSYVAAERSKPSSAPPASASARPSSRPAARPLDKTVSDVATVPFAPGIASTASMTAPMPAGTIALLDAQPSSDASPPVVPAPPTRPRRRSRARLLIAMVVILLGGAGAGAWFFGDRLGLPFGRALIPGRSR